ncbi:MAG: hypothetical protein IOD12_00060 [Silvanigrellales bacterium]|nr:hypothetical protein [Silvanigrellales bacterium]
MKTKLWVASGNLVVLFLACKNPALKPSTARVPLEPGVSRIRIVAPAEWTLDTLVPPDAGRPRCPLALGTELKVRNATLLGAFLRFEALDVLNGCPLRSGYIPTQSAVLLEGAAPLLGPAPLTGPQGVPSAPAAAEMMPSAVPAGSSPSKAFLDVLAYAEGTKGRGDDGYNIIFTHAQFTGYRDHPRQLKCSGGLCSDASGRYQFLSTTWDEVRDKLRLTDFGKANQDKGALAKMEERGVKNASQRLDKAAFSTAVLKLGQEWASMPGSPYGQPTHSVDELWRQYQQSLK